MGPGDVSVAWLKAWSSKEPLPSVLLKREKRLFHLLHELCPKFLEFSMFKLQLAPEANFMKISMAHVWWGGKGECFPLLASSQLLQPKSCHSLCHCQIFHDKRNRETMPPGFRNHRTLRATCQRYMASTTERTICIFFPCGDKMISYLESYFWHYI